MTKSSIDDVAAEGRAVGDHVAIADAAIVRDMAVHHQEIVIAHPGHHAAAGRARVEGNIFANGIALADDQFARLAAILEILGRRADGGEGKHHVAFAERGAALDRRVRMDFAALADSHARADHAVRTDLHLAVQLSAGIDDRGRVDAFHVAPPPFTRDRLPWRKSPPGRPVCRPPSPRPAFSKTSPGASNR